MMSDSIDERTMRVLEDHLLAGPRPGQCRCGYGDARLPVRYLGRPHSAHVTEELRKAGVLMTSGPLGDSTQAR